MSFFSFVGCAHYAVNQQVESYEIMARDYLAPTEEERSDELLLILAFSGGGTRAAALSYGVLEALDKVSIPAAGIEADANLSERRNTLLDQVDIISSVSGGSVTSAYYALYGDQTFVNFKDRFLYHNVNRDLFLRALSPINMIRLSSTYYGRSDLAAEYYDKLLFNGATFGDLKGKDSPNLFIQATDIVDGIYFGFTPAYFSLICSDLDSFPISRAVAASAAFPGPFTAITLRNYAGTCGFEPKPWMTEALEKRDTTSRIFYVASHASTYLDPKQKPYVHLVDGGVADNLALRGPLEVILGRGGIGETLEAMGREKTRRVVFVVVDAGKETETTWGLSPAGPGILGVLGMTSSVMISSYNFETIDLLRRSINDWSTEVAREGGQPIDFYLIRIAFNTLKDEKEREYFSSIPTSFNLSDESVDALINVSRQILYNSSEFQRLVSDLGGTIPVSEAQETAGKNLGEENGK
ncbi:MAG: patatin-like phospholipase family protein [Candidatus Abyssubacteria bacterium]